MGSFRRRLMMAQMGRGGTGNEVSSAESIVGDPSKDTSSLYELICEDHAGTTEDPIPYNERLDPDFLGMTLVQGKIYTQKGALYECIEGTGIPVYDDLDNPALARYVKAVE